jgi:hypothetical protein
VKVKHPIKLATRSRANKTALCKRRSVSKKPVTETRTATDKVTSERAKVKGTYLDEET